LTVELRSRPDVRWHPSYAADEALRLHVAAVTGVAPDGLRTGRMCPTCGSDAHGRPWVAGPGLGHHRVGVSLARAGGHLVTAVSPGGGAVGVDVESIAEVDRRWADLEVPTTGEPARDPAGRAAAWCRAEAVAKLAGTGLRAPGAAVPADHRVVDLPAPAGFAAALVWSAPGQSRV
jgi:4'-phosphopantetheinyl transferase